MRALIVDDSYVGHILDRQGIDHTPGPSQREILLRLMSTPSKVERILSELKSEAVGNSAREAWKRTQEPRRFIDECFLRISPLEGKISSLATDIQEELDRTFQSVGEAEKTRVELFNERIFPLLSELSSRKWYNITDHYLASGGCEAEEVCVLAQPLTGINPNHSYNNPEAQRLIAANFDVDRARSLIAEFNPDVLLLDMNFPSPLPEDIYQRGKERLEYLLDNAGVIPDKKRRQNFPLYTDLDTYERDKDRAYTWLDSPGALTENGGVILGAVLQQHNIPFTFWTHDFPHGTPAIGNAYMLGLLEREDVEELLAKDEADEMKTFECSSSGRIVISPKWNIIDPYLQSHVLNAKDELKKGVRDLDRALRVAYRANER